MLFLFSLYFIAHLAVRFFSVKYGKESKGFFAVACYSIITSAIAVLFFLIATGFSPLINSETLVYATIIATVVVVSQYCSIIVYRHMNILDAGMIHSSLVLILTFFVGAGLYNENISWIAILRMFLAMLSTVLLVWTKENAGKDKPKTRNTLKGYILCGVMIFVDLVFTILLKGFAMLTTPHDESSCFMLVNMFTLIFSAVLCRVLKKGNSTEVLHELKEIGLKKYGYIALITLGSNMQSLSTVWIHAMKNSVVIFTPLTGAISVIVQVIVSKVVGKEKIPIFVVSLSLLSAVLSFFG